MMRKYSYQRALTGISVTHAPLTGINRNLRGLARAHGEELKGHSHDVTEKAVVIHGSRQFHQILLKLKCVY